MTWRLGVLLVSDFSGVGVLKRLIIVLSSGQKNYPQKTLWVRLFPIAVTGLGLSYIPVPFVVTVTVMSSDVEYVAESEG